MLRTNTEGEEAEESDGVGAQSPAEVTRARELLLLVLLLLLLLLHYLGSLLGVNGRLPERRSA
jgi:hypothetical protein